jgi:hypothetical protein
MILWIGVGLVISLNAIAAMIGSRHRVDVALAVTAGFALTAVGFGIWVGRVLPLSAKDWMRR